MLWIFSLTTILQCEFTKLSGSLFFCIFIFHAVNSLKMLTCLIFISYSSSFKASRTKEEQRGTERHGTHKKTSLLKKKNISQHISHITCITHVCQRCISTHFTHISCHMYFKHTSYVFFVVVPLRPWRSPRLPAHRCRLWAFQLG